MSEWLPKKLTAVAGAAVNDIPWLAHEASSFVINHAVGATRTRPHPWSMVSEYTSWQSLTDRSYLARHRPAVPLPDDLPDPDRVKMLFARPDGRQRLSTKSTCLFPSFAQYLTDGFIRTDPSDPRKTTSNHEIDLCPLYGRTLAQTAILRLGSNEAGERGRLRSQKVRLADGTKEEYAPFLYIDRGERIDPVFAGLDPPLFGQGPAPSPARRATLFAFGGDRANSTPFAAMMNTLLLREHNRLAGELERRNPGWDDERVFQTARNILIPMYIKLVVVEYINHITPLPFRLVADPSVAWKADWNRPNWITGEFSLLYRWHSLMPDEIVLPGGAIPLGSFGLDNTPLLDHGLLALFAAASAQPAAALGAFNTAASLLPLEIAAVKQARFYRLDTYNNYRRHFHLPPARYFSDITKDPATELLLKDLYGTPDRVEFYPGLFAEDRVVNSPLPNLILTMVAVDAFSQALTNPLLSEHVYNAATFTSWGLSEIEATNSLRTMLDRNVATRTDVPITMTQPSWQAD
jgi:prostaglandin-endoperoxide synthase 2